MKILLGAVGKTRSRPFARAATDYLDRLSHYAKVKREHVREGKGRNPEDVKAAESDALRRLLKPSMTVVALHEHGKLLSSVQLSERIEEGMNRGRSSWAFLIGGAHGHDDSLLARCDWQWSLSPLTLPHELALVVTAEQLYRAFTIMRGEPYHKP